MHKQQVVGATESEVTRGNECNFESVQTNVIEFENEVNKKIVVRRRTHQAFVMAVGLHNPRLTAVKIHDFLHSVPGICVCCGKIHSYLPTQSFIPFIQIRSFLCVILKMRKPQHSTIIEFVCETGWKM